MYALVKNGVVQEIINTPRAIELPDTYLDEETGQTVARVVQYPASIFGTAAGIALGLLPVIYPQPTFDPTTQTLGPPSYAVGPTSVVATVPVVDMDLPQARESAWQDIRMWREARKFDPLLHGGKWFDADPESQRLVMGATLTAFMAATTAQSFGIEWGTADDAKVSLNADGMIALGVALSTRTSMLWAASDVAWTALVAATDCTTIRGIVNGFKTQFRAVEIVRSVGDLRQSTETLEIIRFS